jgi:hypothetical protein
MPVVLDYADADPRTAIGIIRRALRSLGVLRTGEEPTARESADALHTMNDMLNAWRLNGIDLEYLDIELPDIVPYPDDHISAIRYNLALELSAEYGVQPPAVVVSMAGSTYANLKAHYFQVGELSVDAALNPRYNANDWPYYSEDLT